MRKFKNRDFVSTMDRFDSEKFDNEDFVPTLEELEKRSKKHEVTVEHIIGKSDADLAIGVANLGRVTEHIMKKQGSEPYKIAEAFEMQCRQFGITLPADFVNKPK